jgi:hypothetical protein
MDNIVLNAIVKYYKTLCKLGYMSYKEVYKLLVLSFYRDFTLKDYRGILSSKDYQEIDRALNCLYGTSCLIPYPNYLNAGRLYLGEISELAQRIQTLEDTEVVKAITGESENSDIIVEEDTPIAPIPTSIEDFHVNARVQHDNLQNEAYVLTMADENDEEWVLRVNKPDGSVSYPCGFIGSIDAQVSIWGLNVSSDESCTFLAENTWGEDDWAMFVDNTTGVQHDKFVDVYLTGTCEKVGENDYVASLILANANGQALYTIVQGDAYTEINLPYID